MQVEVALRQAIINLLVSDRLSGEILLTLPRVVNDELTVPLGLTWQDQQVNLQYQPALLNQLTPAEIKVALQHEVMHLIWQHPVRYANYPDLAKVTLATDIAVNQYLKAAPPHTMTLARLEQALQKKIAPKQDSKYYLDVLNHLTPTEQGHLEKALGKLSSIKPKDETKPTKAITTKKPAEVSHSGWQVGTANANFDLRRTHLQSLITQAWHQVDAKSRGLLPGKLLTQLTQLTHPTPLNWRQLLAQLLGQIPQGRKLTRNRFNRRQPLRMELPGQVERHVAEIYVFIDNSGSMTDQEITAFLGQIPTIAQRLQTAITVVPFDAQIHAEQVKHLENGQLVTYQRVGGGGTSFQVIFDWLKANQVSSTQATIVILTDGWGEKEIDVHHYQNILWVLSADNELSVQTPVMKQVKMGELTND